MKSDNKTKWFNLAYGIIFGVVIIFALVFMTQYKYVYVGYIMGGAGQTVVTFGESYSPNNGNQQVLYDFFSWIGQTDSYGHFIDPALYGNLNNDFGLYAQTVYDIRVALNSFNSLIIVSGIIGLVTFAFMLIFANHSRRIYYKSNLYSGIALPLINVIFSIVMIVQAIGLIGKLSENYHLVNLVSVCQDPANQLICRVDTKNFSNEAVLAKYNVNSLTLIFTIIIFVGVIAYSVFLIIHAVRKYKATADERNKIIERALEKEETEVALND